MTDHEEEELKAGSPGCYAAEALCGIVRACHSWVLDQIDQRSPNLVRLSAVLGAEKTDRRGALLIRLIEDICKHREQVAIQRNDGAADLRKLGRRPSRRDKTTEDAGYLRQTPPLVAEMEAPRR